LSGSGDGNPDRQFEAELQRLRAEALTEIDRLDAERRSLKHLVAVVDRYLKPVRRTRRAAIPPSPLDVIHERPGVRSSMVATALSRDIDDVAGEIQALELSGRIRRDGLGWKKT
jgi:hypothetical protein